MDETFSKYVKSNLFEGLEEKDIIEFSITGKCKFRLYRSLGISYDNYYIDGQFKGFKKMKEIEKYISEKSIQDKGYEILKEYIDKKYQLVVYGHKVLEKLENDELQVLFVTYSIVEQQGAKMKAKMISHKYNKTNIIIYDEKSPYWNELKEYGEIIGVFREK